MKVSSDVEKSYFPYSSISSSFLSTNLPKSVSTYAFEPFGESFSNTGSTSPRFMNSFIRVVRDLLSPLATSRNSDHLFGDLSDFSISKPLALATDSRMFLSCTFCLSIVQRPHLDVQKVLEKYRTFNIAIALIGVIWKLLNIRCNLETFRGKHL